ncbi:MAG: DMT family transporter [Gammaproteobacteria bacterium]|jgi:drug/metabolite transporter (DMT)-like permease|nr:DMT family transporter [Gammaproteobacteria bacterium]
MSAFLYLSIILLWGFTWFAIKNQIGVVPIEISLIYRFAIAAIIIFVIMLIQRASFRFSLKQHAAMALLGSLLFSINFFFFYTAAHYLTSGLMAIILSTSVIMIMLNNLLFLKKPVSLKMFVGGIIGLSGLACIFWPELESFSLSDNTFLGLILSLIGAYSFAWANQVSTYCTRLSIPLISSTFYGMLYGIVLLNLFCLAMHINYAIDSSIAYVLSLSYLAIPGSVLGFLTYLGLVKRVGPEKAVYATLFFPLVALMVSTFFESFTWAYLDFVGIAMIILGNVLILTKPKPNILAT